MARLDDIRFNIENKYKDKIVGWEKALLGKKKKSIKEKKSNKKPFKKEELKIPSPKINYKFEMFKINSKTLSKFVFPDNRRRLSSSQISSLCKCMYSGKHFDSPMVVNEVEGMFRIVDGNHRIEAIKKVIARYPRFSIEVLLIKYSKLDSDGEIAAFRIWNSGKTQSLDDFIQSVAKTIPIINWVKKEFSIPVTIYKTPKSLSIRNLFNPYLAAKKLDDMGYALKRENFVNDLLELKEKDYKTTLEHCKQFSKVFGLPNKDNKYYGTTFFGACWYVVHEYNEKNLWDSLRDKIMGDDEILEFCKFGGRTAHRKMISLIKEKLRLEAKLTLN